MLKRGQIKSTLSIVFTEKELKLLNKRPKYLELYASILISLMQINKARKDEKKAFWIPSSSDNPDPLHQRFYGRYLNDPFLKGEIPGQRYGCKCSIGYK